MKLHDGTQLSICYNEFKNKRGISIVFVSSDLSFPVNLTVTQWKLVGLLIDTANIFDQETLTISSCIVTVSEVVFVVSSVISELPKPS